MTATSATSDDSLLPFALPAVARKKIVAAFDGGRLTSDGGVLLLAGAERHLQVATHLADAIADDRDPARVRHSVADILRARILAIACGYEDANDLGALRNDPAFKLACGRLPETGQALCSQPTVSRLENAPSLRQAIELTRKLVDLYCASYRTPPARVVLDIDDTVDAVHGQQQLSFFNAHYDMRCFLPIHVYDTAAARPVAVILRTGKTPSGIELRGHLRRLFRRIRRNWPNTRITLRGDSHYGRPEVMEWCEANGVDYVFGLAGNAVLDKRVAALATRLADERLRKRRDTLRRHRSFTYAAGTWRRERRVVARLLASEREVDTRFIVTSLSQGDAVHLYERVYCARGEAENLIKLHKAQLASDRTSCRSPLANQVRLVLHTAAFWLMRELRLRVPAAHKLRHAEFTTLRLGLVKVAARITETTSRVRIALASVFPNAAIFRRVALCLQTAGP